MAEGAALKTYTLKLSKAGSVALLHTLTQATVEGRNPMRMHGKLVKMYRQQMTDEPAKNKGFGAASAGEMVLDESQAEYLGDILIAKVDKGLTGEVADGYLELLDQLPLPESSPKKKE